jgi:RNA recognition motif-containing protein
VNLFSRADFGSQMTTNRLFVGNLPPQTNEADLATLFVKFGTPATKVDVIRDDEHFCRGFAYVDVADEKTKISMSALSECFGMLFTL